MTIEAEEYQMNHDCDKCKAVQSAERGEPVAHDYRTKYDRGCYKCLNQFCPGNCIDTTPPAPQSVPVKCWCHKCNKHNTVNGLPFSMTQMILCPECGNKRCPNASDHQLDCTGSNEAGQHGSVYTAPQPVPVKTYHDGKPWPVAPKPWVGLTDEEKTSLANSVDYDEYYLLVENVEAKLKAKNERKEKNNA
jgi:hypothetical protein